MLFIKIYISAGITYIQRFISWISSPMAFTLDFYSDILGTHGKNGFIRISKNLAT